MIIDIQRAHQYACYSSKYSKLRTSQNRLGKSSFIDKLRLMLAKRRQRSALTMLDERMLRDIGITKEQAEKEAKRYFWQ